MSRQEISDPWPSIYWKRLNWPFSCILKAIRAQFRAMEKRRKHSTLREKLL
jgi:hypothetical protein